MKKSRLCLLLTLLVPVLLSADALRSSTFEIKGWQKAAALSPSAENRVFSPIGLALSLAMLGEGTGGTHRANISDALGLLSDFGVAFSYVMKSYRAASVSNAVSITLAPSLWSREYKKLDLDYRHSLQRNFEAETGTLVNALPVNAWTEAKTDGRITEVLNDINPRTEILLLNAVAFEGAWRQGFDRARTVEKNFTGEDAAPRKMPFMHGEFTVTRIAAEGFTAVRLPFAAPGVSMLFLLPDAGTSIERFCAHFTEKLSIDELKSLFRAESGEGVTTLPLALAIPSFEILSRWDLKGVLAAFKVPESGYARIGSDFKINEVIQAAYVKIDERGYSLTPGVTPPKKVDKPRRDRPWRTVEESEEKKPEKARETFTLNRPFLFFVWDENSDTLLLAGQFAGR